SLDVEARPCLMVGGGPEAEEKSGRLLDAGARVTLVSSRASAELACLGAGGRVTLVSPEATAQLESWAEAGRLTLHRRRYEDADLDGIYLAVNTVKSDPALSRRIYAGCEARRILISAYDQPEDSNFVMV